MATPIISKTDPNLDLEFPKPGAPLQMEIHPKNQALIDAEVARRLELVRTKLSRWQLWRFQREYDHLHRKLNRAGYNRIVQARSEIIEQLRELYIPWQQEPTPALKKQIHELRQEKRIAEQHLRRLQSTFQRFNEVRLRLENHQKALQIQKEEKENRAAFFKEAAVWEGQIIAVFRQSPRLHHITRDSQGREITRIPKIDHILLKPDKVYFRIKTVRQGLIDRLTRVWHSALPYGVDVKALTSEETTDNMTAACGRVVTVERSPRSQNIFYVISRLDAADGIPKMVRMSQVTDHYPMERHKSTVWAAGMGEDRKITHFDFEQYPNILVAGAAGGGKSNLINSFLCQLITMNSPDELRLFLIDNKGGVELSHFEDIPHLLTEPVIRTDAVLPALKLLSEIIDQRYQVFLSHKAKKLVDYNKKVKKPIPRVIVVIDELATLLGLGELTGEIHNELRKISSLGRAAGVHLIVATQHPSVDVLPGWIKTNLTLRIASRMPNHTASQIVVDSITAAHLPEVPGRMVFRRGGFELTLQTPYADDDTIAQSVTIARQYPSPEWQLNGGDTPAVVESAPVFGFDEYVRMALIEDGSLSAQRIFDAGAKNHISQPETKRLGKQVIEKLLKMERVQIDDDWYRVAKQSRGYRLELVSPLVAMASTEMHLNTTNQPNEDENEHDEISEQYDPEPDAA